MQLVESKGSPHTTVVRVEDIVHTNVSQVVFDSEHMVYMNYTKLFFVSLHKRVCF